MKFTQAMALSASFGLFACVLEPGDDTSEDISTKQLLALNGPLPYRGVNLSSAEFGVSSDGSGALPGSHGTDYIYPSTANGYQGVSYFMDRGATTFRIPFRWERLQTSRRASLNSTELSRLRTTVEEITNRGGVAILDPHNYARYGTNILDSESEYDDFADFWRKLADAFKSNPKVIFGLMNEPYGFATERWVSAANRAIAAIRATGANQLILVPGMAYSGAHSWNQSWYGTPNAQAMLNITDSGNNFAFEVHQYFDSDYSGTNAACATSTGVETVQGFTSWLKQHQKRGFLGEFGSGTSSTCQSAVNGVLSHLEANADVWLGYTWWAGGPWWGNYFTGLDPQAGTDRPQMSWLVPHFAWNAGPVASCTDGVRNGTETGVDCGGSCPACTSSCTPSVYEAENMTKSTGGAVSGGWNIWSNGSVSTTHNFVAGTATVTVRARGSVAAGVWPTMELRIGGAVVGSRVVNATEWTDYSFTYAATAGSKSLAVFFTNDLYQAPEDRNLYVDKVTVSCPSSTSASCTDGVRNGTETGVDCGGSCPACVVAPSCTDGVRNGNETGVDCGGSCPACVIAPSCTDGAKNGTETDVDCGGSCSADCAVGQGCGLGSDCQSGHCTSGTCSAPPQSGEPCSPAVTKTGGGTGNFETTGAVCYKTTQNLSGWGCSNFTGRTVLVNDVAVTCGAPLPAQVGGAYYFEVSSGQYPWASIYWW
jgi:endoglucanase